MIGRIFTFVAVVYTLGIIHPYLGTIFVLGSLCAWAAHKFVRILRPRKVVHHGR